VKKFHVEFTSDRDVTIEEGQTLLEASLASGIPHFHVCGGNARCSTCRVLVLSGEEELTSPNEKENQLKKQMQFPEDVRLACQTYVKGEGVKLTRIIRDESDIDLYVGIEAAAFTEMIGEEREVAVCFIDIRDSTQFVATHLPFDVIHIMRKLFNCFYTIIEKNGGRIVETLGDGLYAVFGLKKGLQQSAEAALKSGYQILENIEELNANYFIKNFGQKILLGISIHTGTVVAGDIRLGGRKHLLVMGYPVNVAARLQNATKELKNNFVVSAETLQAAHELLPDTRQAIIQLRGIVDPVTVYLLGSSY
jgi:adenylate cyclase